jgi:hypothetical protein
MNSATCWEPDNGCLFVVNAFSPFTFFYQSGAFRKLSLIYLMARHYKTTLLALIQIPSWHLGISRLSVRRMFRHASIGTGVVFVTKCTKNSTTSNDLWGFLHYNGFKEGEKWLDLKR